MNRKPTSGERTRTQAWNASYQAGDNLVFCPHEEVVRFLARHFRKRVGLETYQDRHPLSRQPRILVLGCGIGRHIKYCHNLGLEAYGIDLSATAVDLARQWAEQYGMPQPHRRIVQGDARQMPWNDAFFDGCVSHGVLDSMYFDMAREVMAEARRVLSPEALFYLDAVSGDDSKHAREYHGDEIVETEHERDTIQSYYNYSRVLDLVDGLFALGECTLIRRENVLTGGFISRYHMVVTPSTEGARPQ
jgi:SAM-dependent methyltransferase